MSCNGMEWNCGLWKEERERGNEWMRDERLEKYLCREHGMWLSFEARHSTGGK